VFPYGKGFFIQRLLLFAALAAAILTILGLQFAAPAPWVAALAALLAAYTIVWGLSPFFTDHWLTTTRLILRQGWYFKGAFPLREIVSLGKFEGDAPLGIRAQLGRRRLFVTGSKVGLLALKLRSPRRFWSVLGAEVDEVVFDVDSPDGFLEAYGGRTASLAPVQPERADPYLWD
jgi:hypothetical protein